jgi:hypothetical protein
MGVVLGAQPASLSRPRRAEADESQRTSHASPALDCPPTRTAQLVPQSAQLLAPAVRSAWPRPSAAGSAARPAGAPPAHQQGRRSLVRWSAAPGSSSSR